MIRVLRVEEGVEADVVAGGRVFHAVVAGSRTEAPDGARR